MLIDNKSLQQFLASKNYYMAPIDGKFGTLTHIAVKNALRSIKGASKWSFARQRIAVEQMAMQSIGADIKHIDGIVGPETLHALEVWQNHVRGVAAPNTTTDMLNTYRWPTQSQVPEFYGPMGENQVLYIPPYQFYLYDSRTKVNHISVHKKVEASLDRVLRRVYEEYGAEEIHKLHLDRFFGSLNIRRMRGGNRASMHSWGIALDFDANRNALRSTSKTAAFAKPAYDKWWKAWEDEGWVSLGRERNYDWMHVQAARL